MIEGKPGVDTVSGGAFSMTYATRKDAIQNKVFQSQFSKPEEFRWRPWPCAKCSEGTTPIDYLIASHRTNQSVPSGSENQKIDGFVALESGWLKEWVLSCPHQDEVRQSLQKLDEGSEHIVYVDYEQASVVKLTKEGIFGDYYQLRENKVVQYSCTPCEYLFRLQLIEGQFGFAPHPLGVTEKGQIVSRQKFVPGTPPTQKEVNEFLSAAGLVPVKESCWIWKMPDPSSDVEIWVGDAREDNFVKNREDILPIDLRMWFAEK